MKKKVGLILIIIGIVILLAPVWMYIEGVRSQQELERRWFQIEESAQSKPVVRVPVKLKQDQPVVIDKPYIPVNDEPVIIGKISIPAIGLEAIVIEGVEPSNLKKGPGHIPGTALPGEFGNCCIAGHRNMYGSWFRKLNRLKKGDIVLIETPGDQYQYHVKKIFKVQPDNISILNPSPDNTLTLITCMPVPRPTHRLIVVAGMDPMDK